MGFIFLSGGGGGNCPQWGVILEAAVAESIYKRGWESDHAGYLWKGTWISSRVHFYSGGRAEVCRSIFKRTWDNGDR